MSGWENPAIMPQSSRAFFICVIHRSSRLFSYASMKIARLHLSVRSAHRRQSTSQRCVRCLCALLLASAPFIMLGCATSHATLSFAAPSTATASTPFTVTVHVIYQGKPDTVINSAIHFTSSDPAAILPPDYYFTSTDAGSHTWTNGFTLSTPGNQTISGAIHDAIGINGSATIAVAP